jgi:hypothetical protein
MGTAPFPGTPSPKTKPGRLHKRIDTPFEVQRGGKFVLYSYCVSLLVVTFKRPSEIYFIRSGESAIGRGMPLTLLTILLGWWGIPWGPVYSIQSLVVNLKGGKDVTTEVLARARQQVSPVDE